MGTAMPDSLSEIFSYHFMVNAFRAGTIVAIAAGVIGWFMVLRRQSFAGHTLAVVAFPGAAGATLLGMSASFGFFAFSVVAAIIIAAASRGGGQAVEGSLSEESAVIGTVQAFALAAGFLFVSLFKGALSGVNSLLFGSFLGITDAQVQTLLAVGVVAVGVLLIIGRPLLFASLDPDVAQARRVPVKLLSIIFLILLGLAAAEASQITGALLVFALLVLPAATAQTLTPNPALSLVLAVAIGLVVTWAGLIIAFYSPYPIGFFITTFAFAAYLLALTWQASLRLRLRRRHKALGAVS
jgi:zinc/manganese transport system permease protein